MSFFDSYKTHSPVDGDGDHVHEGGGDVAVEEEREQPGNE